MSTIFVTEGSTRFDKLIDQVLSSKFLSRAHESGFKRLIIQAGNSIVPNYIAHDLEIDIYKYKNDISHDAKNAKLVISHAGAGTCLEMLRLNKKLLIVVNSTLMDNHQAELADQLEQDGYAIVASVDNLVERFAAMQKQRPSLKKFPQQTNKFKEIIEAQLNKIS